MSSESSLGCKGVGVGRGVIVAAGRLRTDGPTIIRGSGVLAGFMRPDWAFTVIANPNART
jgi:hypothetical protein